MNNSYIIVFLFLLIVIPQILLSQETECWEECLQKNQRAYLNKQFQEASKKIDYCYQCLPKLPDNHRLILELNELKLKIQWSLRDDDKDDVINGMDDCPDTKFGLKVNNIGCPTQIAIDQDKDGIPDNLDRCPKVYGKGIGPIKGCPDADFDGIKDGEDKCPTEFGKGKGNILGCPDSDHDGIPNNLDKCPETPENRKVNAQGCLDDDRDGIPNTIDKCPDTEEDTPVNAKGCADHDKDGVEDDNDDCPMTPIGVKVNYRGCPDEDGDGVEDENDQCPNTPKDIPNVNFQGCPDEDYDDVRDARDQCPSTAKGLSVNADGCPDQDKDEIPDFLDQCLLIAGNGQGSILGCPDEDQDGVMDSEDICPTRLGLPKLKGCPLPRFAHVEKGTFVYEGERKKLNEFKIGIHEIPQELWLAIMGNLPLEIVDTCLQCPVVHVTVRDINKFIKKLHSVTGTYYRLPKFSEWAFAARERKNNASKYSGGNKVEELGWFSDNSEGTLQPIGQKKPNNLGLFDMTGNAWELVEWEPEFQKIAQANYCIVGGGFNALAENCTLTNMTIARISSEGEKTKKFYHSGFRLVQE